MSNPSPLPHPSFAPRSSGYFLPFQSRWVDDRSPLKIIEKSRQVGLSSATAFSALLRAAALCARLDVYVSSRHEMQAQLFIEDARAWSVALDIAARTCGQIVLDRAANASAYVLECPNGRRIYSLSSNPRSEEHTSELQSRFGISYA